MDMQQEMRKQVHTGWEEMIFNCVWEPCSQTEIAVWLILVGLVSFVLLMLWNYFPHCNCDKI